MHLTVVSDFQDGAVDINCAYITHVSNITRSVLDELMRGAHVFAMISRQESFGLVFVEALAGGCAVLAPRRAAQMDIFGDCGAEWERKAEQAMQRYGPKYAPDVVANAFFDALTQIASVRPEA